MYVYNVYLVPSRKEGAVHNLKMFESDPWQRTGITLADEQEIALKSDVTLTEYVLKMNESY